MSSSERFSTPLISAAEAERFIDNLKPYDIHDIGSREWLRQHDWIEKLNAQAHHSVMANTDEFVVESLISYEKIGVLVHELLAAEIWKQKVMPLLMDVMSESHKKSIKPYVLNYHESAVINLLECVMYHRHACAAAGSDVLIELADYCSRKLVWLNSRPSSAANVSSKSAKELMDQSDEDQLIEQIETNEFNAAMCSVSVLRFLTDNSSLSISLARNLTETNDTAVALATLMDTKPWRRRYTLKAKDDKSKPVTNWQIFQDGQWVTVKAEDLQRLNKYEAQVWLALNNLLVDPSLVQKYEFTSFRKESIMKIKKYINETLVDQIPVLLDLQRALEQLTIMDPPHVPSKSSLVIETLPEIRDRLLRGKKWSDIAAKQRVSIFVETEESRKEEMTRLADMYNMSNFEEVLGDPKCSECGAKAEKRCSRCKNEWYCTRECQVKAWKKHKSACDVIASDLKQQVAGSSS